MIQMTADEINRLLEANLILEPYKYNLQFNDFIKRYQEKNGIEDIRKEELVKSVSTKTSENNVLRGRKFIETFSSQDFPIYWGDDAFWSLLFFRATYECNVGWDDKTKSAGYVSKHNRNAIMNILKENVEKISFENLNNFLINANKSLAEDELITYWIKLASKRENVKLLAGKEPFDFIIGFNSLMNKSSRDILKAKILYVFNTEKSIEEIQKIHEYHHNNASVLEVTTNLLNKKGLQIDVPVLNFIEPDQNEMIYIHKKSINPQALVQQHILTKNEVNLFLEMISKYLIESLDKKGITTTVDWVTMYDYDIKKEKKVYEFKSTGVYEFRNGAIMQYINDVLKVSSTKFAKEEFKNQAQLFDTTNYNSMENFYRFMNDYIPKVLLLEKMEKELVSRTDFQPQKVKI